MKVSYVTILQSAGVPAHTSAVALGLLLTACQLGCHRAVPVVPATSALSAPLDAPPIDAVWIRLPSTVADVPDVIRQAMHATGVQVSAENRQKQWVRAGLGGAWEDPYRYREWHLVANYGADSTAAGTLVVVRALESFTSYLAALGRSAAGTTQAGSGFTRTGFVSNAATGEARAAWMQLELLVSELALRGGEVLTDLTGRRRRNVVSDTVGRAEHRTFATSTRVRDTASSPPPRTPHPETPGDGSPPGQVESASSRETLLDDIRRRVRPPPQPRRPVVCASVT